MTKANATKPAAKGSKPVTVEGLKGENETETMARIMVGPYFRHGIVANGIAEKMMGKLLGEPRFDDYGRAIKAQAQEARTGNLTFASELLTAQALSLDAMFTELARRAGMNMGDYPQAAERYARLAFKAQANSRATLEALIKLHQPREQTVKHVHVNQGGQAVVADNFHQHGGQEENGKSVKQSDATEAAGERAALSSPNPDGQGVPIPSCKGQEAVQNARRDQPRSAER